MPNTPNNTTGTQDFAPEGVQELDQKNRPGVGQQRRVEEEKHLTSTNTNTRPTGNQVVQTPDQSDEWQIPKEWPKVFARLEWADGVIAARGYRGATAAVFHRLTARAGTSSGCTESLRNIAKGLGIGHRTVQGAVKAIRADGFIAVTASVNSTYICVPVFEGGGAATAPKGNSSSKEKIKKTETGKEATTVAVAAGKSGATKSLDFEEEAVREYEGYEDRETLTAAMVKERRELTNSAPGAVEVEDVAEWIIAHVSETPTDFEIESLGKHCWPTWEKHFTTVDFTGALVVWKNDRAKFRRDVQRHLRVVGLPQPIRPTDEDIRAGNMAAQRLDVALSIDKAIRLTLCQGCKLKRQLRPGQTHCFTCSKAMFQPTPEPCAVCKTADHTLRDCPLRIPTRGEQA